MDNNLSQVDRRLDSFLRVVGESSLYGSAKIGPLWFLLRWWKELKSWSGSHDDTGCRSTGVELKLNGARMNECQDRRRGRLRRQRKEVVKEVKRAVGVDVVVKSTSWQVDSRSVSKQSGLEVLR